jgi:hypothetical protein
MTRFIDLLESGRKIDREQPPSHLLPCISHVIESGRRAALRTDAAWRLHRKEARALADSGLCPPGGWRALCALLAGTGVLTAHEDAFRLGPAARAAWLAHEATARSRLVESFTRFLIPPSTAASLFLAMGIHPLLGLRLARRLHKDSPFLPSDGFRDEQLLPPSSLSELRKGVFATLSVIFSSLRRLDPHLFYPLDALEGLIQEAVTFGTAQIEGASEGLPIKIDDLGLQGVSPRTAELTARTLVEEVLIPSHILRRFDDTTFCLDPGALGNVSVGHLGLDAQRTWLQCFLVDRSSVLVA